MSEIVTLAARYYYCEECQIEHEYRELIYELHQGFASNFGRFNYEIIESGS